MPFHRLQLGRLELFALQAQPDKIVNAAEYYPTSSPEILRTEFEKDPTFFGENSSLLRFTQSIYMVVVDGQTILFDTGMPVHMPVAVLNQSLAEAGFSPDQVDIVFLTHRDIDHVGGNCNDGKSTFKNARYLMVEAEYHAFRQEEARRELFEASMPPLDRLELISADLEFFPGFQPWITPGHRSYATSVLVDESLLITADTWHSAIQVTYPDWSVKFDSVPTLAAKTRKEVMEFAMEKNLLLTVTHTPQYGLGRIDSEGDRRVWNPLV